MTKFLTLCAFLVLSYVPPVWAQTAATEADIKRLVPYSSMLRDMPTLTLEDYNAAVRALARERSVTPSSPNTHLPTPQPTWSRPSTTPRSSTSYDWHTGNSYNTHRELDGTTQVNGFNLNTGSTWNTTIKPDGDMTGFDKDMNYWQYDARTKVYMNLGTGTMCIGEGVARTCF
jgi:hypothetical protein